MRIPAVHTPKSKQKMVNISEVYNLWDTLCSKYNALERLSIYNLFIHDVDLKLILALDLKDLQDDIKRIEDMCGRFGIRGPDNHVKKAHTSINAEIYRDQFIAAQLFIFHQENVEMLLKMQRTTTTNDELRGFLVKLTKDAIERTDRMSKYSKIKGYIEQPPLYPLIPADVNEKIDTGEAFHLWDHLTFRYDNIYQTKLYLSMSNDIEFKALLKMGLKTLNKQQDMLENELQHFGIPLPIHPPSVNPPATNTEIMRDDYMFKNLLTGMQGAAIMHALALKQCITNDRVRKVFKQLLNEELDIYSNMVKFGKIKT